MEMSQLEHNVRKHMNMICDLSAANSVLSWDQETYMPSGAAYSRAEQTSTLAAIIHQMMTGDTAKKLSDDIKEALNEKKKSPL
ncbi:MAG: hypothetical protein IPK11_04285 [Ignavibacteria bacterium]|nr:hypothetical protein [Ignavibacteria bacterium]